MAMKKVWSLVFILSLVWVGTASAHGDISKLPSSVQILQYQMGLWMDSDNLDKHNGLAMAYYRTKKYEEAKGELEFVLEKDPNDFDALDGMTLVLIKMNKNKEALEYLKKALAINADDVMVHVHGSVIYENLKMEQEAKAALEKAKELNTQAGGADEDIDKEIEIISGS